MVSPLRIDRWKHASLHAPLRLCPDPTTSSDLETLCSILSDRCPADATLGLCRCFSHRVSGNGAQEPGRRGDCGALDYLFIDGA